MSAATISPAELAQLQKSGKTVDLIDVRTPVEFREVHVDFARNVPLDALDAAAMARSVPPSAIQVTRPRSGWPITLSGHGPAGATPGPATISTSSIRIVCGPLVVSTNSG